MATSNDFLKHTNSLNINDKKYMKKSQKNMHVDQCIKGGILFYQGTGYRPSGGIHVAYVGSLTASH